MERGAGQACFPRYGVNIDVIADVRPHVRNSSLNPMVMQGHSPGEVLSDPPRRECGDHGHHEVRKRILQLGMSQMPSMHHERSHIFYLLAHCG